VEKEQFVEEREKTKRKFFSPFLKRESSKFDNFYCYNMYNAVVPHGDLNEI
jgi:hypothetical protein